MTDATVTRATLPAAEERRRPGGLNGHSVWAMYRFQMVRFFRTIGESLATPVITTALYFVVFGSAIGSRMTDISDIPYGAFIVPGLMMLTMFTESLSNSSFGI